MAKRISTLALTIFLATSVLTIGQTNSRQSANDAPATETGNVSHGKDNHSESRQASSTDGKRKDKKKTKHAEKPALSEEQEFEKMLLSIFG